MLRLSPGGKTERTSDFEGWSPEEVKEPNLRGQLLENKMYTKKLSTSEIKHLSSFAIVEPKSEPHTDTMPCSNSDIHHHGNDSAESSMER